ncbi:SulP family inorganic anion transporter [Fischerella sp. JS2]|uniref:SulP family inorganic anion transporter n=1 Tax=Fischerella sp. JS2 TaxID=2597771 RepID=UPI0028E6EB85|nr:SulP family inorganic anion transporter [Fischerella sp. JS2]
MLFNQENVKKKQKNKIKFFQLKLRKNLHLSTIQTEILAGATVALALIPESLAFAAIAKVNPMVALYTSFCMAVVISLVGGRPAMISAATGSMALLMTTLVEKHGVEYLFAATILTGIIQFLIGVFKLERCFSFIPQSAIAGFVNALGILIFIAQLRLFAGEPWQMYVMVAVTLAIVYLFPRITKSIPSPLIAIITMTIVAITMDLDIRRVGDIGEITRNLPVLHVPQVSFSLETLLIILPYSLTLAIVGLLESLLTATLVDELTDTRTSKNRETRGQGIANTITGFMGGMAGCGMVGQSIINNRCGAKGRLSTFVSGAFLLFSIFVLRDIVQQIPMAALVGVMIMVSFETFDWNSLKILRKTPLPEALVMPFTVIVALLTHDLAKGVLAGVILNLLIFGWQAAQVRTTATIDRDDHKVYYIHGQLFFGSANHFVELFDYGRDTDKVVIDFHRSHVWDQAAANAIAKVVSKYHRLGKQVTIIGLNQESHNTVCKSGVSEYLVNFRSSSSQVA